MTIKWIDARQQRPPEGKPLLLSTDSGIRIGVLVEGTEDLMASVSIAEFLTHGKENMAKDATLEHWALIPKAPAKMPRKIYNDKDLL